MALTLEIVTPEARVYSDTIDTVVIPTTSGEVGILPGHIPLLTQIEHGELRVTKNGLTTLLAVSGGFAEIEGDHVHVLAENAITEEKIDENAVEAALKRAEDELKAAKDIDPQQYEHLQNLVRYSGVQLAVKRRRRSGQPVSPESPRRGSPRAFFVPASRPRAPRRRPRRPPQLLPVADLRPIARGRVPSGPPGSSLRPSVFGQPDPARHGRPWPWNRSNGHQARAPFTGKEIP